ncbi:MAG: DsbA family protein [Thermoleophilia bacterium]|nr:DsbA family protein [Thermoleophilia bacterium]
MSTEPVEIEMFADVSCPWCHGALETSRRLLDELAADPAIPTLALQWRFMRLHPMPAGSPLTLDEYYSTWAPDDDEVGARARDDVRSYVRGVGVWVDFTRYTHLRDPFVAHRLLAIVRDDDGDDLPSLWSLARAVFNANFVRGVDITDHAALRGGVERGGLVLPVRIWEQVADPDVYRVETLADHERALQVQLDGVPRMVIDGTIVPTWIDPDEVRRQLRAAIDSAASSARA